MFDVLVIFFSNLSLVSSLIFESVVLMFVKLKI